MVCRTLDEAAKLLALNMSEERNAAITVNVVPEVLEEGSVLQAVCETDPRLILCIKNIDIKYEYYGMWAIMSNHVIYTDYRTSMIEIVDSVSGFLNAAYYAAGLHRRDFPIVYPIHMHEVIQNEKKGMLESPQFLNCFVSGFRSETKRIDGCGYMAQIIHFNYSCSYREWRNRKNEISLKTNEIVNYAKLGGIEDWRKAYEAVRYCVKHWRYGKCDFSSGLEYTTYGAIVNNTAVCMGIALAVCTIFKELGIPCRYVRGIRNGEGHAWNMVFIRGGWFYIDVTDAICRKDPLFHWGMVQLQDREVCEGVTERLSCNCTPDYIKKMTV